MQKPEISHLYPSQGLEEVVVKDKEEVMRILEEGSLRRTTAATKMNAASSRSHTVFTITVTVTEKSIVGQVLIQTKP